MALVALVTGAMPALANTILGVIDWDPPPGTAWTADALDVNVAVTNSAGDNWLSIGFTNTTPLASTISGSASNLFAGTWRSEYWIEFDFWSDGADPTAIDWTNIGLGDAGQYLANLSSIDWIGIYIERGGAGDESYGIDDFSLMVPEPAEILMLAAAFGVGLLVFRRMRLVPVATKLNLGYRRR